MNDLCSQYEAPASIWLPHTDLMGRYLACCLCMRETAAGMVKVLQAVLLLFLHMKQEGYVMHESECSVILPHIIGEVL